MIEFARPGGCVFGEDSWGGGFGRRDPEVNLWAPEQRRRRRFDDGECGPYARSMGRFVAVAISVFVVAAAAVAHGTAAPSRPTSGRCAGAWNLTAPPAVRALVRKHHVRQATAKELRGVVSIETWKADGTATSTQTPTPGCVIVFILPPRRTLTLLGSWHDGTVDRWSNPIYGTTVPVGSGNACVADDGMIHGVGPFTARSRCSS